MKPSNGIPSVFSKHRHLETCEHAAGTSAVLSEAVDIDRWLWESVCVRVREIRRDSSSKSPVISRGPQLRANGHHSELTANAKTHSREKKRPE